jgi:hypothetical protein
MRNAAGRRRTETSEPARAHHDKPRPLRVDVFDQRRPDRPIAANRDCARVEAGLPRDVPALLGLPLGLPALVLKLLGAGAGRDSVDREAALALDNGSQTWTTSAGPPPISAAATLIACFAFSEPSYAIKIGPCGMAQHLTVRVQPTAR